MPMAGISRVPSSTIGSFTPAGGGASGTGNGSVVVVVLDVVVVASVVVGATVVVVAVTVVVVDTTDSAAEGSPEQAETESAITTLTTRPGATPLRLADRVDGSSDAYRASRSPEQVSEP